MLPARGTSSQAWSGELESRTGICTALKVVARQCPRAVGETMLSLRSAKAMDVVLGGAVSVDVQGGPPIPLRVVGLYRQDPASPFWWGSNPFAFGTALAGSASALPLDAFFVTESTVLREYLPSQVSLEAQLPLRRGAVTAGSAATLQPAISDIAARLGAGAAQSSPEALDLSTGLGGLLSQAAGREHQMATIVLVVDLELVLLALLVLYGLMSGTAQAREPEVALARLRGYRLLQMVAVALGEPAVLLCAAVPIGLFLAWLIVSVAAPHALVPGTPVVVGSLAIGAALAAFGGGLVALGLGSGKRLWGKSGRAAGEQSRTSPTRGGTGPRRRP